MAQASLQMKLGAVPRCRSVDSEDGQPLYDSRLHGQGLSNSFQFPGLEASS